MPLEITKQPTSPNMANNTLVLAVTSSNTNEPQYQFIARVVIDDINFSQTVKQQPNPNDVGVFDLGHIVQYAIPQPLDEVWTITGSYQNTNCGKDVKFFISEEDAPSITGSVTQSAEITGSNFYFMLTGLVEPDDKINWNWDSSSYFYNELINDNTFSRQVALTSWLTSSVQTSDYGTVSLLNGNLDSVPSATNAQDIYGWDLKQYNSSGTLLSTDTFYNYVLRDSASWSGDFGPSWSSVYTSQSFASRLNHFPAGPQNYTDAGITISGSTAYYTLTFFEQATDQTENRNGQYASLRYNIQDPNCDYTRIRFSWKNEFGVWDYYNFTLAENSTSNLGRSTYQQVFVPFSSGELQTSYSVSRRGQRQFVNKVTKSRSVNSDWLTQDEADKLRELFYSANVYIQDGTEWKPVVITSAGITEKTNPRTQKNFQYLIEFQPANQPNPRI